MPTIPLVRASQLRPIVRGLEALGLPVAESLERAHIPAQALLTPDMLIPALPLYGLLGTLAAEHGIANLGCRIAAEAPLEEVGRVGRRVTAAPDLAGVLRIFLAEVREHSSIAAFWLTDDGETVWLSRRGGARLGAWQVEQYVVASMVRLIQLVDPTWRPARVHLQTAEPQDLSGCPLLGAASVSWGRPAAAIAIPRRMLALPTRAPAARGEDAPDAPAAGMPAGDFLGSLRAALTPYLLHGYPDVRVGAEVAGMSVRTLQRRLTEAGTSYSDVIGSIRYELACQLLRDPTRKVMDVAAQLGYSAPGHLTRAFQRWAGMTPRAWRRAHAREHERN